MELKIQISSISHRIGVIHRRAGRLHVYKASCELCRFQIAGGDHYFKSATSQLSSDIENGVYHFERSVLTSCL